MYKENIRKKENREDKIKNLIEKMNELSEKQEYEKAKDVFDNIKSELEKPASNVWPYSYVPMGDIQTVKDVYDLVTSEQIRLNPKNFKFSDFLNLLTSVHERKNELQGAKYSDIDRQRKIVAEELVCRGVTIPAKWKGRKPNRRFLDIAHNVNPSICKTELRRRETVKLWKAIERGDRAEIEKIKKEIRKYR